MFVRLDLNHAFTLSQINFEGCTSTIASLKDLLVIWVINLKTGHMWVTWEISDHNASDLRAVLLLKATIRCSVVSLLAWLQSEPNTLAKLLNCYDRVLVANHLGPDIVDRILFHTAELKLSGPLAHLRLIVLHYSSEDILGELAQFICSSLSQFQQGQGVAKVQSGKTLQLCLVSVVWRVELTTGRIDHLPI